MITVAVVGGGISGLTLSHHLARAGVDVTCLEPGEPGGVIRSERRDGFLCEWGPEALLDGAPETRLLIEQLGLEGAVVRASPAARRRLIYLRGRLRVVPSDPFSLLSSDLLSSGGKWRLMREPFVRPRPANNQEDESVLAFGERRLGSEAAHHLLAPAAIGVFAGDAARLSVQSAFPRLHALEQEHGSLLRGLRTLRKEGGVPGRPFSFREGLGQLTGALAAGLGQRLRRGRVTGLVRDGGVGWRLRVADERGSAAGGGAETTVVADQVVLACPVDASAGLLAQLAPAAATALRAIPQVPAAIVYFGWRQRPPDVDLAAYGFLVARGEGIQALGCQYESSVFPDRAPPGGALLRVILGGAFDPAVATATEAVLIETARSAVRAALALDLTPDFAAVLRVARAIPQYELGHELRVRTAESAAAAAPGLHLLGNGLRGIGVNDCIRNAAALARLLTA